MTKIIMIHSFRRGVGRSTMIANSAALLALEGKRVGVIDTNIQSPSLHFFFRLSEADIGWSLNNYLWGKCTLAQAMYNVTPQQDSVEIPGQIFLIPGTCQTHEIARVLSNSYSFHSLNADIESWAEDLQLDVLFIDPRSGLIEMTLASIAIADTLVVLMRLDRQDFEGTGMMLHLLRKIDVSEVLLVVNEVPKEYELNVIRKEVGQKLQHDVAAVIPHSRKLLALGSNGLYALRYPDDPLTDLYRQIAKKLLI
ncbi:cobyrinic acid ac-diamide synthase [Candidatus Vecturithrix granuli]|uniref:Cobyrinic acid ac-diamide synthase n=1 Tax=Vecturithrix granuli TaxID=1499967 RepID=A0A0S6WBP4_VECG1|nr:cobyrinic acid ac-diamide synthase [Candidatus Vecturithrix granuli]